MANYEIFDLLYSEFRDKFDDDNVVFNQKCVVGKQRIRIHFLHEEKILMLLNALVFLRNCKKNLLMFLAGLHFILTVSVLETILLFINLSVKIKMRFVCLDSFVLSVFSRKKFVFKRNMTWLKNIF